MFSKFTYKYICKFIGLPSCLIEVWHETSIPHTESDLRLSVASNSESNSRHLYKVICKLQTAMVSLKI